VCECPNALIRDYRAKGIACDHRDNTLSENLRKWKMMLRGHDFSEGEAVVRLKTNMKDKDPAFRDRVLFRISERKHERVKNKYKVWPMLEMSWAIDDMLLGVTHIIRGKDLMIEGRMEEFIWDVLGLKKTPEIILYGLLQIEGAKISKSKARAEVEGGVYSGWDDPRTWSVQSLKRRGFKPEAIREFILSMGLSKADIKVPIENLYSINRKLIDLKANRYFFVSDPVKIIIKGCREGIASVPLHPEKKELKKYKIKKGDNVVFISKKDFKKGKVRLKDYVNVLIKTDGTADYAKDQKTVYDIKKIHFVVDKKMIPCKVLKEDGSWDEGLCEKCCENIKRGEIIQFERYGFCKLEKKGKKGLEFIYTHP
jgi:glutamyl-tRNA synthetase